ncbi:DUF6391 domain-containing protein [Jonquetella anthropi]|uniref:DUF6391 domain-containing protein n=1 Tax=Jonquetella anthropi TaxID=428712 RepID=UPI00030DF2DB|nr:DUF6391 domain-containing protein [Jonquetella anthropi]
MFPPLFLFLLFLLPLAGFFTLWLAVPLLLIGLAVFAFGGLDWQVWRPDRLWKLLTDQASRRNAALQNATVRLLREQDPASKPASVEPDGFGLSSQLSSAQVWDAAHHALYRLRDGEKDLAVTAGGSSAALTLTTVILAVLLLGLLLFSGHLSLLTGVLAVLASRAIAPAIAPSFERFALINADVRGLRLADIRETAERQSALGGRFLWSQGGFFISTADEGAPLEAEILDETPSDRSIS